MRFEEWKKTQDDGYLCARHVWEAAQKLEREACALVCDVQAMEPECPERAKYCADSIRARSNA